MAAPPMLASKTSRSGNDTYTVTAKATDVSYANGDDFVKIAYSVKKNGKTILPIYYGYNEYAGTIIGCRSTAAAFASDLIREVSADGKLLGWVISASTCGMPTSQVIHLLVLGSGRGYGVEKFTSSTKPLILSHPKGVELWMDTQIYGDTGGTALSFYVPRAYDWTAQEFRSIPLPDDFSKWPLLSNQPGFTTVFVAGLEQKNVALLRGAVTRLFKTEDQAMYGRLGIPATRADAEKVIELLEKHPSEFAQFSKWTSRLQIR